MLLLLLGHKICDTDYHYIENIETNFTEPKSLPIVIGNCVWVGQGVTISKGAVIPDWTIISQHSLVNQVYKLPPYCVIGGFPARLLTHKNYVDLIYMSYLKREWLFNY